MIDAVRRNVLADRVHEYIVGLHTNFDFEQQLFHYDRPILAAPRPDDDPLLSPMLERSWCLCFVHGDLDEYRLTGEYKLPPETRRDVLRWILFLRSDREYEWPVLQLTAQMQRDAGIVHPLLALITFGARGRIPRQKFNHEIEQFMLAGDHDVWPFKRRGDLQDVYVASCPLTTNKDLT